MIEFRKNKPSRRDSRKKLTKYQSYKKTLREDFNYRCGYCDDSDNLRIRNFAIDHFVPRTPKKGIPFKNKIDETDYYNLVYSCSFCNISKSNKWPTCDGKIHNDGKRGFIDPTTSEYCNLFKRNNSGGIECNNYNLDLSKYIIKELRLWLPIHSLNWRFEKIINLEEKVSELLEKSKNPELKEIHYEILQIFKTLAIGILKTND